MESYMIVLRLIHILFGIFWVGTALFFVLFFEPTIKAAGAAGGSFMARLALTRFPLVMALSGILTVAAGFVMYVIDSGFQIAWISTPSGLTLTIGSVAGILAFALGALVQVPSNERLAALQKEIQAAGGPPTASQTEELNALLKRISDATRWEAVLMVVSVLGMAMARELPGAD